MPVPIIANLDSIINLHLFARRERIFYNSVGGVELYKDSIDKAEVEILDGSM